jgi:hypothetical protein
MAVVPRERLGRYTVASLIAAEGEPDARSPFIALFFPGEGRHTVSYQVQLARSLVCPNRSLNRQFQELRLANAINRAFDQEDVLTIYLNRVYLGPNVYGIEAAAKRYLGKNASGHDTGRKCGDGVNDPVTTYVFPAVAPRPSNTTTQFNIGRDGNSREYLAG